MNFATYSPSMYFMEATYLVASILFILSLKMMSHPDTARRGMFLAEGGMFAAIVGTLIGAHIITWTWLIAGLAFGALAAALVGIGEFMVNINELGPVKRGALGFEIILGALTTTGSLIAAGKLQGVIQGKPIQFRGQNIVNLTIFVAMVGCFFYFWFNPQASTVFYSMLGIAFLFGVMLVIPIGSADMPVVMSLLNSYAGLAAAATGFVLGNNVLIIAGTLDGFSGFILSVLMCKAMNRSITNVLFGGFGAVVAEANVPYSHLYEMEQINPEFPSTDVAVVIGANDVVNPDARDNPKSLIAGMPILEVDRAKSVIVLKRGQGRGFSGLENPLFFKSCTSMLYGDAKSSLTHLAQAVQHV